MKSLVVYHSKNSGAAKSILFLKKRNAFSFQKISKETTIFNFFRLILLFIRALFIKNIILNGIAVIANPNIQKVLKVLPNKKIILYWHEGEYHWNQTLKYFKIKTSDIADFIASAHNICDSQRVKEWLSHAFLPNRQPDVLYECIDVSCTIGFHSKSTTNLDHINVLAVGNLCTRKGFDDFLKIAEQSSNKINFKWAGKNVEYDLKRKDRVKEINENWGYNKVEVLGFSNHPSKLYSECDVFFLPSIDEPFGIVYLEALLYGKFVIASPNSGFSELLKNKPNLGYVYTDLVDLVSFIDNRLLEKISQNDYRKERHLFAKSHGVDNFHENLTRLIAKYENATPL
ncbi:glycosyltransferase family 4 protein [Reichenbachiella sp.]